MQLVAQIRRVRRLIPAAKALVLVAHDYDNDPGKPQCAWNDRADIDRVVTELVNDAGTILAALDGVELDDVQAEAVGLLALVAGQDVEPGDTDGTWRIAPGHAAGPGRVSRRSGVTPYSQDHFDYRDGLKAHLAVEPDTGLITACELTAGNVGDAQAAPRSAHRRDRTGRGACRLGLRIRRLPRHASPNAATPPRLNRSRSNQPSPAGSASMTSSSTAPR